uniref:GRF-type domain-containing protein n=1 Tax=Manihot esculenta TaxID=3983 RepID=A0A2C9VCE1_MANES
MMTEGNQGRRFYDCGRFQHFERCNFFRWVDGENCQSCEVVMPRIKCKLQECEDEITKIHLREAELLNEMNKIKELNTKLENTQREAEASQKQKIAKKNYYYQWICRMCIFLIGILCAMVLSGLLEK